MEEAKRLGLRPVRNVSPLIRAGRWGFFLFGIAYGAKHLKTLSAKEAVTQKEYDKIRAMRKERLAREKMAADQAEKEEYCKVCGVDL